MERAITYNHAAGGSDAAAILTYTECPTMPKHDRRYRFPGPEWWEARTIPGHVSSRQVEYHPDAAAEYGTTAQTIIPRMIERIVERFDPICVWMFGSMVRGDCNKHSDVDLMIIMPEGTDHKAANIGIRVALSSALLPTDILVNTPGYWNDRVSSIGTVQYTIARHGMILYG